MQEQYNKLLNQTRNDLKELLSSLSEAQWQTIVIGERNDWTVQDIVAHLVENEKGMSIHVHKIRKGRQTVPDGFDVNEWNAGLKERAPVATPAELIAALDETRQKTLEVLNSLQDEEWELTGHHPSRGQITIAQYYETIAGHDSAHLNDIKAALNLN